MPSAKKKTPAGPAYQLKITLAGSKPPIWRRVVVPANCKLETFHQVIQTAMGWTDTHLHAFEIDGETYQGRDAFGDFIDDMGDRELDAAKFRLAKLVNAPKTKFHYDYDFGDGWRHIVVLEKILPALPAGYPPFSCPQGAGACPPEDCGGIYGYYELLEILADPAHEEHAFRKEWLGRPLDPAAFDIAEANEMLKEIRYK